MMLDRVWRDRDELRTMPRTNLEFTRHILFGFSLT